jgi:carbohydrate-selective porin OprB
MSFSSLFITDLTAIATEAISQENQIDLTKNSLDFGENYTLFYELEKLSEKTITITPNVIFSHDATDIDWDINTEVGTISLAEKKTDLAFQQQNIPPTNLLAEQEAILEILATRFTNISDSINRQINQINNLVVLKQLLQIAEITPSLQKFEAILLANSNTAQPINSEQLKDSFVASDLDSANQIELFSNSVPNSEVIVQESSIHEESTPDTSTEQAIEEEKLMILGAMLSQLNGSPYVFGTPSTVIGNFKDSTHLTGDWGGSRLALAKQGIFIDVYATTVPQGLVSGGKDTGTDPSVTQNIDAYLNVVDPWPGAILHVAFQSKIGNSLDRAGTLSPSYYGTIFPVTELGDYGLLTEYYLIQAISPQFQFVIGKASAVNFADTNVFANHRRYQFQNAALNNNLMLGSYIPPPSTWIGAIVWEPTQWLKILTAVADPNGSAENFADNFFKDILVAQEYDFSYDIAQKPGNFRIGWIYSSKGSPNFDDPLNVTGDGKIDFTDPIQTTDSAFMVFLNFDQYLFTIEPTTESEKQARKFYTPRGLGIFGRFGIGPSDSNFINSFYSLGIGAKGIIPGREYDQFGFGWYYLDIADGTVDLLREVEVLLGETGDDFNNETGLEAYYNFAVTPALQLTFNAQYIFNPFLSTKNDGVFVLGGRVNINF